MFEYGSASLLYDKINQLRDNINLPPINPNYYQMIRTIFKRPMVCATLYSKFLLPRPNDWPENEFMVGPIMQEDNDNFQPSNDLHNFLCKWQNEKII